MEIISQDDVVMLANSISMKCDLNIEIFSTSQCTSDFVLALYLSIMGELPKGALPDCRSIDAQEHNITCIVKSLSDDYLHLDLSHISASEFVKGEVTVIYNLLEILDGLLDFMLEQIEHSDSGDDGDVDSDEMSIKNYFQSAVKKTNESETSTCTADLINLHLTDQNLSSRSITTSSLTEELSQYPLKDSTLPDAVSTTRSPDKRNWIDSKPVDSELSQYSLTSSDLTEPVAMRSKNQQLSFISQTEDESEPRPMLIESIRHSDTTNGSQILEDLTDSLRNTYRVADKPVPDVMLDTSVKGSAISVSDVTSPSSSKDDSSKTSSVQLEEETRLVNEISEGDSLPRGGIDVADGIPKPRLDDSSMTESTNQPSVDGYSNSDFPPYSHDWKGLLDNLQKTVEESKRIREKYFSLPDETDSMPRDHPSESMGTSIKSTDRDSSRISESPRRIQRNVRFEDDVPLEAEKRFKDVLVKEKQLQMMKNKILSDNFRDHLEEVEESERNKMRPLVERAVNTEKCFRNTMSKNRQKKDAKDKRPRLKKNLAAAAKWKSWQAPVVVRTPQRHTGKVKTKIKDNLVIGEHDLLPTLISEFPGLKLSPTMLNDAWKKQFRQIELLTRGENDHVMKKKRSEKQLQEAHHRHELLMEIMRKEHEHSQRVRDAKERAIGEQETMRKMKERRQQSARVRRYYRDYQLQMRARMLKRRTKEEKLFKHLFEEGLSIQRSRLNDLRQYARDKRNEQRKRQRDEIASLENYYRDQFAMLGDVLKSEKEDLKTRDQAQTKLLRQMKRGLRQKMEQEICNLQEQISRDDDDIYFREMEADRVRRQLQLATYNAKFHSSISNSFH